MLAYLITILLIVMLIIIIALYLANRKEAEKKDLELPPGITLEFATSLAQVPGNLINTYIKYMSNLDLTTVFGADQVTDVCTNGLNAWACCNNISCYGSNPCAPSISCVCQSGVTNRGPLSDIQVMQYGSVINSLIGAYAWKIWDVKGLQNAGATSSLVAVEWNTDHSALIVTSDLSLSVSNLNAAISVGSVSNGSCDIIQPPTTEPYFACGPTDCSSYPGAGSTISNVTISMKVQTTFPIISPVFSSITLVPGTVSSNIGSVNLAAFSELGNYIINKEGGGDINSAFNSFLEGEIPTLLSKLTQVATAINTILQPYLALFLTIEDLVNYIQTVLIPALIAYQDDIPPAIINAIVTYLQNTIAEWQSLSNYIGSFGIFVYWGPLMFVPVYTGYTASTAPYPDVQVIELPINAAPYPYIQGATIPAGQSGYLSLEAAQNAYSNPIYLTRANNICLVTNASSAQFTLPNGINSQNIQNVLNECILGSSGTCEIKFNSSTDSMCLDTCLDPTNTACTQGSPLYYQSCSNYNNQLDQFTNRTSTFAFSSNGTCPQGTSTSCILNLPVSYTCFNKYPVKDSPLYGLPIVDNMCNIFNTDLQIGAQIIYQPTKACNNNNDKCLPSTSNSVIGICSGSTLSCNYGFLSPANSPDSQPAYNFLDANLYQCAY